MKVVFKILVFSILINLATGIMLAVLPVFNTNPEYRGNLQFDSSYNNNFISSINGTISATGTLEGNANWFESLLDKIGLGIFNKWLNVLNQYMFGLLVVLENLFGGLIDSSIFVMLKTLVTIGYVGGAFYLFTGKTIN